ncbi:Protein hob3 [Smittium culicis]|uniref:Protein hob3 n=1 Tax=Smittium culicis TaxID=133412 RepID=A0A1R1YQA9_9FUNG|nr:Protein hob3 [Smittium culicis]
MSTAQKDLATNLADTADPSKPLSKDQIHFKEASTHISNSVFVSFEEAYNETVIMPIEKYCKYLPTFESAISRCKRRLTDLEKAKAQHSKAADKSANDPFILSQANEAIDYAENVYETLKSSLIDEIPKLINARIFVIEPSFKSLIKLQLEFFKQCLENLTPSPSATNSLNNESDDVIDHKMNSIMQQIRDLSVCNLSV